MLVITVSFSVLNTVCDSCRVEKMHLIVLITPLS